MDLLVKYFRLNLENKNKVVGCLFSLVERLEKDDLKYFQDFINNLLKEQNNEKTN